MFKSYQCLTAKFTTYMCIGFPIKYIHVNK